MLPGQYDFQVEKAIRGAEKRKQIRSAKYKNQKAKKLPPLKIGQSVVLQTNKGWIRKIKKILKENWSSDVVTSDGAKIRRNRVMLRPVDEVTSDELTDSENEDSTSESNPSTVIHENAHATPAWTRSSSRVPVP